MTNILEFPQVRSAFSPDFGGKYRIFLLIKIAERGFDPRTSGLWAQHASTLLRVSLKSFFAAPISKSSQMPVRAKRERWNDGNAGYV